MIQKVSLVLAWLAVAVIGFATLSSIGLRPHLASPHREHFAAFALVGVLFSLAYPRRPVVILGLVVIGALSLELLQMLTPDRHARIVDAAFKVAGGFAGVVAAQVLLLVARRR
ncbi:VanZ family protein [Bradyrhizobium sp. U87765 SZCCT0131]|uniref:VanZ family protein n=1 Tax=unclassified Bradyrhizobium TaxID=2631580 RepID=UPI001BA5C73C|nr:MULTISPECIES: VanZ family protein [unclassified Bradyrhizobium]MBR1217867.1 VanZ family protein [Bradyrhizobium sp. U87765 SZCCT0131]MBR1261187.1 VanZ family protein [Bradyrhizobium sp. U87765 SZCCT0134]MBR1303365.1 VanZ family protein [Bradyrhizobium sp. U87765 SZCCT0110]MBR1318971.1 VanZ family protein [Bradyrhizobium sp. U87765 SZCCT0109]MBR1347296.1 VanZ family protein [Bradyrhizobium sp. U87765 SZCCT0048]